MSPSRIRTYSYWLAAVMLAAAARVPAQTLCVGGYAGAYPCLNVDLMAYVSNATMGGGNGNSCWGWVDPLNGDEYALMGMTNGTAFVRITDPVNPVYLGKLPKHAGASDSTWRDMKVFGNYAFIVSDQAGNHGMQVFDLTELRNVPSPPVIFPETAWYGGNGLQTAHTLALNEATGYAYAAGDNSGSCSSQGLHMIDVNVPISPTFAGCYNGDGYTHETQCVVYNGPDSTYVGHEVCFNSNEDTITIVDVSIKSSPVMISKKSYSGNGYTHQGWLTEDHKYFILDDELDEEYFGHNTRTRVFDVTDLNAIVLVGYHDSTLPAIDHNQYIKGNYVYQANYRAGLRILELTNLATATLTEVAYFDIYPSSDAPSFNGAWNNFPYFPSGNVIISGIEQGLFIVKPNVCGTISITPATLPNGQVGVAYGQTLSASGGTAPYTFALLSGTLPPGLSLSPAGSLSGTPTTAGTYSFTVSATDAKGCVGTKAYSVSIAPAGCPAITLSPASLPTGIVGTSYSQTITASGGTMPYTFAVTAGALPAGLSLSAGGVLSGTPTTAGSFGFTVTATDASSCTGSQGYTLIINSSGCPAITLSPATLPIAYVGTAYSQSITASGGTAPYSFARTAGALPPGIALSSAGALSGTPTTAGSYSFTIAATDADACVGSRPYVLDVDAASGTLDYVAGMGLGVLNANKVKVYNGQGLPTAVSFDAYAAGKWGVNVSSGDLDGSLSEIVTGPGPGDVLGPQVRGFRRDGSGMGKVNFYAYNTLKFGVNVATGRIDGDAYDEILSGAGPGAVFGPHVRGFNYDGFAVAAISKVTFFAYNTLKFGVNVARADVDGDGYAEILTGPGPSPVFSPQGRGFNYDGAALTAISKINFTAFPTPQYGLVVAGGDVDTDGYGEIVASPGPGQGASFPARFRGYNYDGSAIAALPGFDITPFTTSYGGRSATGNVNGTTIYHADTDELIVGAGPDPIADSAVRSYHYDGATLAQLSTTFMPFGASPYGVTVAAGGLGY